MKNLNPNIAKKKCPCHSGNLYKFCCQPYHDGLNPENALKLMKSRYSAYALNLYHYIIETTHPKSLQFKVDKAEWIRNISQFSLNTQFIGLEILSFEEKEFYAFVTFRAHLIQKNKDCSFTERSYFEKLENKWVYYSGEIS